jgi:hypothetical protein
MAMGTLPPLTASSPSIMLGIAHKPSQGVIDSFLLDVVP